MPQRETAEREASGPSEGRGGRLAALPFRPPAFSLMRDHPADAEKGAPSEKAELLAQGAAARFGLADSRAQKS